MTKTIWILAIATAFVVGSLVTGAIAFADDADDDGGGGPIQTGCALENVEHWDKIIFEVLRDFDTPLLGIGNPQTLFPGQAYDIKVLDTPGVVADLQQIVAADLEFKGYLFPGDGPPEPIDIVIIDVEYAIICIAP